MDVKFRSPAPSALSRRNFVGGIASALGAITLSPEAARAAEILLRQGAPTPGAAPFAADDYDSWAKLASNENPYGPPESVVKAMMTGMKYSNRYNFPDNNLVAEIANHHGLAAENVLLGAGSGEILSVVALALLEGNKKVVGVDPTFHTVYQYATGVKAEAIRVPLLPDYRQDVPQIIAAANQNARDVGLVYLCNPNNPTGRILTAEEMKTLLDGIPENVPVLIDEAYHHFVNDPAYATSVPYISQGRPVIIARTFSKIAALAGMRIGYALASPEMLARIKPHSVASINAMAKWGAVAALKDTESQAYVKKVTMELRDKSADVLTKQGYSVIPSEANFIMIDIRRPVQPVIDAFKTRGVIVGRPFPPMLQHLRVSIGTPDEMQRFHAAFGEIFATPARSSGTSR